MFGNIMWEIMFLMYLFKPCWCKWLQLHLIESSRICIKDVLQHYGRFPFLLKANGPEMFLNQDVLISSEEVRQRSLCILGFVLKNPSLVFLLVIKTAVDSTGKSLTPSRGLSRGMCCSPNGFQQQQPRSWSTQFLLQRHQLHFTHSTWNDRIKPPQQEWLWLFIFNKEKCAQSTGFRKFLPVTLSSSSS